jgi:nucleotide-binding universal stress UspA family protein
MLASVSHHLIQFKRIAVLTDLESDSEKMVRYAASMARWYGSDLLLIHAYPPEVRAMVPLEPSPSWSAGGLNPKQDAESKFKSLLARLALQDLAPDVVLRAGIGPMIKEVEHYRPNLLVLATHGRAGIRKWLAGSVAEEVFRRIRRPVLVVGPGLSQAEATMQKQFERVLFATDLSVTSLTALHYAAGIAHDHEAKLTALYVETDSKQGYSFDRAIASQRLQDWVQDNTDGLAEAVTGMSYIVDFGDPGQKIVEAAQQQKANIVVIGARGLGALSGPASHFLGGSAYEVACSSQCPVLIVPEPR